MPYAHDVVRVTISGTAFGGAEIWSTGFYMGALAGNAPDPTLAWAEQIRTHWTTFFTATGAGAFPTSHSTTAIKLSKLSAATGKAILDKTVYANVQNPITGATGVFNPPQTALVATLLSTKARGLAAKGRMYLPPAASGVGTNGRIATTVRDAIATNLKTFFDAINGQGDVPSLLILASQGRTPPLVGGPENAVMTSLRVGDVYDTQRRRRNGLAESFANRTLA